MIDKGEKTPRSTKKVLRKLHFRDFRQELREKLKGKSMVIVQAATIILVVALCVQNGTLINKVNKVLGASEASIHEIYDDSKVISAYKTGNSDKLEAEDKYVFDKMTEVINQVIKPGMSDYEKEKAIYDWQVGWVNYDQQNLSPITEGTDQTHTPYGVFKSHQAICVGNATTFKLFMDALEIPCKIIHSTDNGEHAWDVVQLENDWYHVDVTFDGTTNGKPSYSNFNIPDSIKDDGSWPWNHDEIPAANGSKYCYLLMNANNLDDLYGIPEKLKEAIDNGDNFMTFVLKDNKGFNANIANYICGNFVMDNGGVYYDSSYAIDGKVMYKYNIESYQQDDPTQIDPEIMSKLDEIIARLNGGAFGEGDTGDFASENDDTEAKG